MSSIRGWMSQPLVHAVIVKSAQKFTKYGSTIRLAYNARIKSWPDRNALSNLSGGC